MKIRGNSLQLIMVLSHLVDNNHLINNRLHNRWDPHPKYKGSLAFLNNQCPAKFHLVRTLE